MSENKLSRFLEDITGAEDYVDERKTTRKETWTEEEQKAYEQIKAMLTPIPEKKIRTLCKKWANKKGADLQTGRAIFYELMLKEYESLRGGKE